MKFFISEQVVSKTTKIVGEARFKGDLRIDGQIEGVLQLDDTAKLTVNKEALVIVKKINAQELHVFGTIQADSIDVVHLILHPGCLVKGVLNVHSLRINAGARYEGQLNMVSKKETSPLRGSAQLAKERLDGVVG